MKPKSIFIAGLLILGCHAPPQAGNQSKEDTSKIFVKVENPAEFPGGSNAWKLFLEKNIQYPPYAQQIRIQGTVRVQFLVDKEGNVSDIGALNDPGGGLAEEAIRLIQISGKWKPAEQNHQKVIYRCIQSITFQLQ